MPIYYPANSNSMGFREFCGYIMATAENEKLLHNDNIHVDVYQVEDGISSNTLEKMILS